MGSCIHLHPSGGICDCGPARCKAAERSVFRQSLLSRPSQASCGRRPPSSLARRTNSVHSALHAASRLGKQNSVSQCGLLRKYARRAKGNVDLNTCRSRFSNNTDGSPATVHKRASSTFAFFGGGLSAAAVVGCDAPTAIAIVAFRATF